MILITDSQNNPVDIFSNEDAKLFIEYDDYSFIEVNDGVFKNKLDIPLPWTYSKNIRKHLCKRRGIIRYGSCSKM